MSSSSNNHQFDHDYVAAKGPEMVAPPPPAGYPTVADDAQVRRKRHKTKSRGDGFWKGCCAALCCCWVLDVCC
nr:cysteine-rich and transmembrane domain-containing protein WIH2-like [Ipomoea batatas]GMC91259.1 cysteine-rich and transmembrane domain-containing protein WIH2-like [Ipomoea batatas]